VDVGFVQVMSQANAVPKVRNHVPPQHIGADVSALIDSLPVGHPPSTTDGSENSPFQMEFGPFLVDEDYAFLDAWSDLNF
jgi:hypothetical protein